MRSKLYIFRKYFQKLRVWTKIEYKKRIIKFYTLKIIFVHFLFFLSRICNYLREMKYHFISLEKLSHSIPLLERHHFIYSIKSKIFGEKWINLRIYRSKTSLISLLFWCTFLGLVNFYLASLVKWINPLKIIWIIVK